MGPSTVKATASSAPKSRGRASAGKLLDVDHAYSLLEKPEHVQHMLKLLLATVPQDVAEVDRLLAAGERESAHRVLHQLKGFLPMFCTDAFGKELQAITKLCKEADPSAFNDKFPAVRDKLDRLCTQAREYLDTQRG